MTEKRFRVHEWVKYNYSEIGEYIDENHTDTPLMNNEVCELLNELNDECKVLEIENEALEDGATKYAKLYHESLKENERLRKENKRLKELVEYFADELKIDLGELEECQAYMQ